MMSKEKKSQLEALLAGCGQFDVDVRYDAEHGHITIMTWELGTRSVDETQALSIQREIQKRTAQYPSLVCYCFDPFSTLVYAI